MTQKCCLTQINFDFFFPPKVLVFSEKIIPAGLSSSGLYLYISYDKEIRNLSGKYFQAYILVAVFIYFRTSFQNRKKNFRVFDLGFITKMLPGL